MALRRKLQQKKREQKIEKIEQKIEQIIDDEKKDNNVFGRYYLFKTKGPVILKHSFDGNIRAKPLGLNETDINGGYGLNAQFEVILMDDGKFARFKNMKSGKYLRIMAKKVDIGGGEGPFTKFKIHRYSSGVIKVESAKNPGEFIAVTKNAGVVVGEGGPWCRLMILRKGNPEPYMTPYLFALKRVVVLETKFGTHLRVKNADSTELLPDGGKLILAQFECIPKDGGKECQLKNMANGKFLRIQHFPLRKKWDINCGGMGLGACNFIVKPADAANYVRFESKKHKGKFIAVGPLGKKVIIGEGKIQSRMDLFTVYVK